MAENKMKHSPVFRNKGVIWLIAVILIGIFAIGVYHGPVQLCGKGEKQNAIASSKENATLTPEEHLKLEEECIRWLKDHKITKDTLVAIDPIQRDTDKLIWSKKYLESYPFADLSDPTIRDEDVHYLSILPNLSWLYLNTDTTKLSENGLKPLETLEKLKTTTIEGKSAIPNGWIKSLSINPHITVYCIDAPVSDESLVILAKNNSKIEELSLGNATAITNKGIDAIGNMQHLNSLIISDPNAITENGLGAIGNLQQLEKLMYSCRSPITDKHIRQLMRCENLKELAIFALKTDMELFQQTAKDLAAMPKLEELTLSSNTTPSKSFLAALGRKSWAYINVYYPAMQIKAENEKRDYMDIIQEEIQKAIIDESKNEKNEK